MRPLAHVALALLAALPVRAGAAELYLGLITEGTYDDNLFSTAENELDDFSARLSPHVEVRDERGHLQWDVQYIPTYQKFAEFGELDGWDQNASLHVLWAPGPRDTIEISESYIESSDYFRFASDIISTPELDFVLGRERLARNAIEASWERIAAPRHRFRTTLFRTDNDFEADRRSNSTTALGLGYLFSYSPRTQVGLRIGGTQQELEEAAVVRAQKTRYYNLSLQYVTLLSPTLDLQIAAGPALIDADRTDVEQGVAQVRRFPSTQTPEGLFTLFRASTCPTLDDGTPFFSPIECEPFDGLFFAPELFQVVDLSLQGTVPEETTSNLTYFANVRLSKRWETVTAALYYTRDASSFQGSQVNDTIGVNATWRATSRFRMSFTAQYQSRESATESLVPVVAVRGATVAGVPDVAESVALRAQAVDVDARNESYFAVVSGRYRLTSRIDLYARLNWSRQRLRASGFRSAPVDRLLVAVGFSYLYGPIDLPI